MQKVVRLKDIARHAGVHEATVSAVLSESPRSGTRVSAETAQRIREIARLYNYRPNRHAQIIRRRRSGMIGIVEFGISEIAIMRSFQLAKQLHEEGVEFVASNARWFKESVSKAIYQLIDARVEGIVLVMPNLTIPQEVIREMEKQSIPVIAYNGTPFEGCPQVRADVEQSMVAMVRHLAGLGYRDIALLSRWSSQDRGQAASWMIRERIHGFERAIVQLGGKVLRGNSAARRGGLTGRIRMTTVDPAAERNYYKDGARAACEVLQWKPRPEALICTNDQFAIGVMQACRKGGVRVPEEVAVVGFGNLEVSPYLEIPLTTVDTRPQPGEARVILELLRKMIGGGTLVPGERVVRLPSPLVIRESCGALLRNPALVGSAPESKAV